MNSFFLGTLRFLAVLSGVTSHNDTQAWTDLLCLPKLANDPPMVCEECGSSGLKAPGDPSGRNHEIPTHGNLNPTTKPQTLTTMRVNLQLPTQKKSPRRCEIVIRNPEQ